MRDVWNIYVQYPALLFQLFGIYFAADPENNSRQFIDRKKLNKIEISKNVDGDKKNQ